MSMLPLPEFPYVDTDTLKKAINGFVLCKLVQYPDNPAWTFTSSFGESFLWLGATVEFSAWVPNANRTATTTARKQVSGWLREENGWDAEKQQHIINSGLNFIYLHRTGRGGLWGDSPILTVPEYDAYVDGLDATQKASAQPSAIAFAG